MKLFGIGGTNGSGKDTVGRFLAEQHNFMFVSVTEILRAEARKRELPVEREVLRTISAEWRRESGLGVLIDKAVALYQQEGQAFSGLAVASLRNPGEADRTHELGGMVVWVDANPQVRYDRIQANALYRDRAEEDNLTFEQFLAQEEAEMHSSGDEATLDMEGVKVKSDVTLINDSNDFAEFYILAGQKLFTK